MRASRRAIFTGLAAGLLAASPLFASLDQVRVGQSEDEVYEALGPPQGQMRGDGFKVFIYDGGNVEFRGETVSLVRPRNARPDSPAGSTNGKGGWKGTVAGWSDWVQEKISTVLGHKQPEPEKKGVVTSMPAGGSAVRKVATGGKPVDLDRLLVSGQVTVVDFYADWCGPCKRIAPKLDLLARQDGDVFLRKVDIVKWNSPVANQYGIERVPNIRVYNRKGELVGNPTSRFNDVLDYIAMAK